MLVQFSHGTEYCTGIFILLEEQVLTHHTGVATRVIKQTTPASAAPSAPVQCAKSGSPCPCTRCVCTSILFTYCTVPTRLGDYHYKLWLEMLVLTRGPFPCLHQIIGLSGSLFVKQYNANDDVVLLGEWDTAKHQKKNTHSRYGESAYFQSSPTYHHNFTVTIRDGGFFSCLQSGGPC